MTTVGTLKLAELGEAASFAAPGTQPASPRSSEESIPLPIGPHALVDAQVKEIPFLLRQPIQAAVIRG
jgi:hypothetical protein